MGQAAALTTFDLDPSQVIHEVTNTNSETFGGVLIDTLKLEVLKEKSAMVEKLKEGIDKLNSTLLLVTTRLATLDMGGPAQGHAAALTSDLLARVAALEDSTRHKLGPLHATRSAEAAPPSHDYAALERRVSALEANMDAWLPQRSGNDESPCQLPRIRQGAAGRPAPDTLFLGDCNFKNIRMSDLTETCKVRTLRKVTGADWD